MTTIKSGTVKYPAGKTFPDKYNEGAYKQNLVLTMSDGSEETLWFTQGRTPHSTLPKGAAVQLLYEPREDGKVIRKLVTNSTPAAQDQSTVLSAEQKRAIAEYIQQLGDVLVYCWDTALAKFQQKVQTEESLRHLATTLYLSAKDRFGY